MHMLPGNPHAKPKKVYSIDNGLVYEMMLSVPTKIVWYTVYRGFTPNVGAINSPNHVRFGRLCKPCEAFNTRSNFSEGFWKIYVIVHLTRIFL